MVVLSRKLMDLPHNTFGSLWKEEEYANLLDPKFNSKQLILNNSKRGEGQPNLYHMQQQLVKKVWLALVGGGGHTKQEETSNVLII